MVGYSPSFTVRSVPPGRVMRMVLARSSRAPARVTASLRPAGAIRVSSSSGASITISTRVPASRASLSQRVNNGMCRQTSMSADVIASSVPLQRPTVSTPTLGIDAHLVGVGAEILGGGERCGDVIAARAEIAQQHDGLALLHVAELEFLAEQHRELGVVQRFVHASLRRGPLRHVLTQMRKSQ